ncbi:M13 family metallopeptidase [Sphingomonas daechungensis]|uniref:M13 family metallopeptidase n=1 Tax=Sphingomonas daechungensis TaxID=1176646 RepID=A0ABX6T2T1_9SPHN|nr:M13 family metallopeptidase [Sphingomonas daechungensis]QNP43739.1 M13 family metallopeptidase [Sphingomonas daechungensis]
MFVQGGTLGLPEAFEDVFEEPAGGPRITAYRNYLIESLKIAGFNAAKATSMADASIAIDRALHAAKLPPVEANDPSKINNARTLAQLQTELPNLNLRKILGGLRFEEPDHLILMEPRYLPTLSKVLAERPIQDIRDYVKLRVILAYSPYLSSDFDKPLIGLNEGLVGVSVLPSQEERALDIIKGRFGQPVSRLYSDSFFPPETRRQAAEMVGLIKEAFQVRMPNRKWLSDATRSAATDKLNALSFWIGYPDEWVDYSSVEITPDLVSSLVSIARFDYERMRQKLGKPWVTEHFNNSHTLPIVVNAAYDPQINGFEVPVAIIQAPMFDAQSDPAVNFCRMGAVLGHEMTHGFDWTGKQFDKTGNMKNWWTPKDSAAFDALAGLLITQANEYEFLPGSRTATGAQQVGENMADLGGITLAHAALRKYLALHPEKDVVIDGQTQDQRCFLAWAQFWAWQGKDEALRSQVARDAHPPNAYRATAPLRHLDAFYKAFGIRPGDPMWLAPEKRVEAW